MKKKIPGISDPLDFRAVEQQMRVLGGGKETGAGDQTATEAAPVPKVVMSVSLVAGFAWTYLREHYDRFCPTLRNGEPGWSPFHVDMWRLACDPAPLVALAAPRNHAKSTTITFAYVLANILFRIEEYAVIVSDTFEGQTVEHIREFQRELRENDQLRSHFKIKKLRKDVEGDIIIEFNDGGMARIKGLGMEGPVRGLKWRNKRPGLFIIDDAENAELVESKMRRDKSLNWIMKDLIPAGRKGATKVRMVGTILHHDASLAKFCRAKKTWLSRIYRAHKDFNDFSEILWPERWPEEDLRAERQRFLDVNNADGYSQEYLNDPISPIDAYFSSEDVIPLKEEDLTSSGVYYIGWDFAVSTAQRADFSVGTVWKVDDKGRKQVVNVVRGRWKADQILEEMWKMEEDFSPHAHFVEKGVIDNAIGPFLDTQMREKERYMNIVKITRNKDKETFGRPLQAMIRRHDVTFNKAMRLWPEVEDEIRKFPKGHDDIIDALTIVAQGLREMISNAPSPEELAEEEYQGLIRSMMSPAELGANPTTGY